MADHNLLISSSKDTGIKFWDLDTNYCFKTLLGHRTEVWEFVLMRIEEFLVTGCGDSELRVWTLSFKGLNVDKKNIDFTGKVLAVHGPSGVYSCLCLLLILKHLED